MTVMLDRLIGRTIAGAIATLRSLLAAIVNADIGVTVLVLSCVVMSASLGDTAVALPRAMAARLGKEVLHPLRRQLGAMDGSDRTALADGYQCLRHPVDDEGRGAGASRNNLAKVALSQERCRLEPKWLRSGAALFE